MLRVFRDCAFLFALWAIAGPLQCEAASAVKAAQWEGLYRNSAGEVLRIQAVDEVISIDIFIRNKNAWTPTISWMTEMKKPDYAEFRQRVEPDGLWLSLSLNSEGALLEEHDPGSKEVKKSFYRRLTDAESRQVSGLPQ